MKRRLMGMRFWWLSVFGFLLSNSHFAPAQINVQDYLLAAEYYSGTTFLHSPTMRFDIPERSWGMGTELMFQSQGKRYWHEMYGFPRIGFQLGFKDFGNADILGYAIGCVPQIDFPLLRTSIGTTWLRFGFGADIITKPYDRVSNYDNNAIGTYLNNMTHLGFLWESSISPHWALRLGATLTHTSNGAVIMPNLGINTAEARFGLIYHATPPKERVTTTYKHIPKERKIIGNFRLGLGAEQFKTPDGPTYPVYVAEAFASYQVSRGSKLNLGLEWNYYPANAAFNQNQDIPPDDITPQFEPSRVSLNLGHELMFGQVSFLVSIFMYVDHPFEGGGWFGNKLGPRIYLFKPYESGRRNNIFIGGYMKSHGTVADYIELSAGFCF